MEVAAEAEERSTSPSIALNEAVQPKEDAITADDQLSIMNPEVTESDLDTDGASSTSTKIISEDENSRDSVLNPILATGEVPQAMIQEEEMLHQETVEEEKKMREQALQRMADESYDERYDKLKSLLDKSSKYAHYLIMRMEQQKEVKREYLEKQRQRKENKENKASDPNIKSPEQKTSARIAAKPSKEPSNSKEAKSKRGRKRKEPKDVEASESQESKKSKMEMEEQKSSQESTAGNSTAGNDTAGNDTAANESQKDIKTADYDTEEEECQYEIDEEIGPRVFMGQDVPSAQPELFTGGILRNYQIEGYQWLKLIYENGVNGILADEMGLGKTAQTIAAICHLAYLGVAGPFLIVAPLSTLPNWISEFERFAPKLPVVLYHGLKDERDHKRKKLRKRSDVGKGHSIFPVVITSYEVAMRDRKLLGHYSWKHLIIDEGHRIKNFQCRLIKELKQYNTTNRLLLTGTPLQNNLSELWSLLNFLLPEIFDDLGSFEAWFDVDAIAAGDENVVKDESKNVLSMIHQILTPFMLRRMKGDVDLEIPPKREVLVYAPLTRHQKDFYEATVDKTIFNFLEKKNMSFSMAPEEKVELDKKGRPIRSKQVKVNYEAQMETKLRKRSEDESEEDIDAWVETIIKQQKDRVRVTSTSATEMKQVKSVMTIRLQNVMMQLRKCCNHPYLLEYPLTASGEFKVNEDLVKCSGKLMLLEKMLIDLRKNGHKVLIYSQMTTMLDILEDFCGMRGYDYCRLDGTRKLDDRREQIEKFNTNEYVFIFLLSTRAGGLGINLTAADTVIIHDSDWNPQCDLQAQDRCHRIGQIKPVMVYRLVTKNTIDERIVERAAGKRRLEQLIIRKGKFKSGIKNFSEPHKPMSTEELLELLKYQDHSDVIENEDGKVISQRDLKRLMDRSDLYKVWEEKKDPNSISKKISNKKKTTTISDVEGVFKIVENNTEEVLK